MKSVDKENVYMCVTEEYQTDSVETEFFMLNVTTLLSVMWRSWKHCNSDDCVSDVADLDTLSEVKEDCNDEDVNEDENLKEKSTVLDVFFLLWISMLVMFS